MCAIYWTNNTSSSLSILSTRANVLQSTRVGELTHGGSGRLPRVCLIISTSSWRCETPYYLFAEYLSSLRGEGGREDGEGVKGGGGGGETITMRR